MRAPVGAPAATTTGRLAGAWRRHRALLLVGVVVLIAMAVAVVGARDPVSGADLDPSNPGGSGARAAAEVLREQGVEVTVVRDAAALEREAVDDATTVVVTSADLLGRSTTERLVDHGAGGSLVVVDPGPGTAEALGVDAEPAVGRPDRPVAADCDDPLLAGLEIEVDRVRTYSAPGCFAVEGRTTLATPRSGLTLFGAGDALANDEVLRGDNAAVVLRLLGQDSRLVWYVPDLADLTGDDGVSLQTLLPAWLRPAFLLLVLAAAVAVAWRARRLGPLSVEPLPVVVRALETTRSRGRLYRRAGAREHAAGALRLATRRRLATRLSVAPGDDEALVAVLAAQLDRPAPALRDLLGPDAPAPRTDDDLITLAADLAALEEEVGHP